MATQKLYPEGLLGKKLGMTQIFTAEGQSVPVTIIQAGPCFVLDVKSSDKHGYSAVQLGFGTKKQQRVNKAETGGFARAGKGAFYHVEEVRCDAEKLGWNTLGQELKVGDIFSAGELVDVSGVSIGRGFQGVVRRHGVKGQPSTRGTHEYRRHIGAIGCRKFPGRVFKNQRMPGHMGNANVTVQNLEVVAVRAADNVILVKGGIPGHKGGMVVIRRAQKGYKPKAAEAKAA
ncbi:MAG: 50S ribosomal protein L3 [Oligoflexia bacterium]|nr:50S ribosomal protein L3 [Oligoflexia bacterium]